MSNTHDFFTNYFYLSMSRLISEKQANVRFGSLADKPSRAKIQLCPLWSNSGQTRALLQCPLCATSGQPHRKQKDRLAVVSPKSNQVF